MLPRSKKNQSPNILASFTQKSVRLPDDNRQQMRDKFRLDMKNAMSLPIGVKYSTKK